MTTTMKDRESEKNTAAYHLVHGNYRHQRFPMRLMTNLQDCICKSHQLQLTKETKKPYFQNEIKAYMIPSFLPHVDR